MVTGYLKIIHHVYYTILFFEIIIEGQKIILKFKVTCDGQFTDSTCENLFVNSFFDECRAVLS